MKTVPPRTVLPEDDAFPALFTQHDFVTAPIAESSCGGFATFP